MGWARSGAGNTRAHVVVWTHTFASLGRHLGWQGWPRGRCGLGSEAHRIPLASTFLPVREWRGMSLPFPVEGFPLPLSRGAAFVPPWLVICPLPRGFPRLGTGLDLATTAFTWPHPGGLCRAWRARGPGKQGHVGTGSSQSEGRTSSLYLQECRPGGHGGSEAAPAPECEGKPFPSGRGGHWGVGPALPPLHFC